MSLIRSLADSMDAQQSSANAWNAALSCLPQLGLSKVVFMDLRKRDAPLILSNACEVWLKSYRNVVRADLDPFARHCLTTVASQPTGIGHLERHKHLSPEALDQIATGSSALGITTGMSITVLANPHGAGVGMNLMANHTVHEFAQLRAEFEDTWRAWSQLVYAGVGKAKFGFSGLTDKERDCLAYIADGMRNIEVAYRLGISEGTVELHLRKARARLGAKTRDQAVAMAIRAGII